ncbi:MAG: response regulator [Eubacteriales bacterium]|nr:response regulator [Eubacteriales bacterium]
MLKLILADDEEMIRESIRALIDWKALGVEVVASCKNGPETLQAIFSLTPDIVMTDIRMPGMSGLDLIAQVCSRTDLTIEFILLSGYAEFEYAKQAISYKVSNYLLKPCNETQIIEAVRKASEDLRRRKKIKELIPDSLLSTPLRPQYKDYINQILDYVDLHFSDPELSLKRIASEVLYMNVDYVSREFLRQTGQKFTDYLTGLRLAKAKALLKSGKHEKIYSIADQVGFSHNPQYFVQIFKAATGLTPRAWARGYVERNGGKTNDT